MLIDTHSHLFVEEFTEDLPQVMERARKAPLMLCCQCVGIIRVFAIR